MGCESFDVVGFDLGPLLQGQTRLTRVKSAYNSLIIGPRGLQCEFKIPIHVITCMPKLQVQVHIPVEGVFS